MDRDKLYNDLHDSLLNALLKKVRSGEATAADLNVARQFLKDNFVNVDPSKNEKLQKLLDELPDEPDGLEQYH